MISLYYAINNRYSHINKFYVSNGILQMTLLGGKMNVQFEGNVTIADERFNIIITGLKAFTICR